MKASIYFLSVVISTFLGSFFLMNSSKNKNNTEFQKTTTSKENWKEDYNECKRLIDTIQTNNKKTQKNLLFVKQKLTQ